MLDGGDVVTYHAREALMFASMAQAGRAANRAKVGSHSRLHAAAQSHSHPPSVATAVEGAAAGAFSGGGGAREHTRGHGGTAPSGGSPHPLELAGGGDAGALPIGGDVGATPAGGGAGASEYEPAAGGGSGCTSSERASTIQLATLPTLEMADLVQLRRLFGGDGRRAVRTDEVVRALSGFWPHLTPPGQPTV